MRSKAECFDLVPQNTFSKIQEIHCVNRSNPINAVPHDVCFSHQKPMYVASCVLRVFWQFIVKQTYVSRKLVTENPETQPKRCEIPPSSLGRSSKFAEEYQPLPNVSMTHPAPCQYHFLSREKTLPKLTMSVYKSTHNCQTPCHLVLAVAQLTLDLLWSLLVLTVSRDQCSFFWERVY